MYKNSKSDLKFEDFMFPAVLYFTTENAEEIELDGLALTQQISIMHIRITFKEFLKRYKLRYTDDFIKYYHSGYPDSYESHNEIHIQYKQ